MVTVLRKPCDVWSCRSCVFRFEISLDPVVFRPRKNGRQHGQPDDDEHAGREDGDRADGFEAHGNEQDHKLCKPSGDYQPARVGALHSCVEPSDQYEGRQNQADGFTAPEGVNAAEVLGDLVHGYLFQPGSWGCACVRI